MKVCFISHSSAKGGAELAVLELIDALKEQGVECYVIVPGHGPLIDELRKREIAFSVISYRWWMSKASPLWKRIAKLVLNLMMVIPVAVRIKRCGCTVVYTNTITVCIGALAARLLWLPHIWHFHEFGYEDHELVFDLGSKLSTWIMDRFSSVCIANSKAVAQKYERYIAPWKLRVVYQSVTLLQHNIPEKAFSPAQDTGIKCVIVGALQEGKKQEDAILAISQLVHSGIIAELAIVGDGDPEYKEYLYSLIRDNKLDEYVRFVGYVENPLPFMQDADIVLMCSRCEAFGRVTIEAMRVGKPVIGARSGGTVELIQDEFNGLLYTLGDYKELADKIRYLYEFPDIARQMGRNGQQWAAKRFTKDQYGKEVLAILKKLVK